MTASPKTQYTKSGDIHIVYQVTGAGPLDLVFVPGFVSHLEHQWEHPWSSHFFERLGSFSGECEVIGEKVGGIAVHIGARVASLARAGEVLVSNTVKDLVAGSGIGFEDRGTQTLKGVPGDWRLFAVTPAG